jgi:hypothetical protein
MCLTVNYILQGLQWEAASWRRGSHVRQVWLICSWSTTSSQRTGWQPSSCGCTTGFTSHSLLPSVSIQYLCHLTKTLTPPCMPWKHMWEWRYSSTSLTLAPDGSVWSLPHSASRVKSPLYPLNRGLVGPIVNLNAALEKRSSSFSRQDWNSRSFSPQNGNYNDYAALAVTQGGSNVTF